MKKYILLVSIILSVVGCGKLTREREVDKSKLRGYDYRLFQKTPAWELAKAVWDDDFKKINELTKKDKNLINYQEPKFGETLLFLTMWHNQKETFKLLLSLGANPNIHDTYDGTSPIIEACKYSLNIEFVMILLRSGANPTDIEVGKRRDDNHTRYTPLMAAAKSGNIDLVELLANKGANLNYKNEFGQSALGYAVMLDKYEIILYLLKKGVDFSIPMYKTIPEDKPIYIAEALQNMLPELNSDEHKTKMLIVDFLKDRGVIYKRVPVPEYVLKQVKDRYPNNWQEYLEKY
jgi:ankyrin repeat protein